MTTPPHDTEPLGLPSACYRRRALCLSAVVVALFFLRVLGSQWSTHFPPQFPDALNPGRVDTYYAVAGLTPFRPSFYWAPRPFLYPAFLWVFGRSSHLVVLAQMSAYCAAFAFLGATARKLIRTRLVAYASILLLVLVAAQGRFALWNTQILSESLGISLGIVMLAMWWRVAASPSPPTVTWAWVWTIAWLLERDAHTFPVAVVVVPVAAGFALLTRDLDGDVRRRLLVGSAIALLVCGYVYTSQRVSRRNQYTFANDIGLRVLPDPSLRAWFVQGGMPLDDALRGRQGKSAFDDDRFFVDDPSLARFWRWADGPGSRRMALSFVVRAPDWYRMLRKQSGALIAANYDGYDTWGVLDRLPPRLPLQLGGPGTPLGLVIWLVVAGAVYVAALARAGRKPVTAFVGAALLMTFVDIYVSFAADALEVDRHLVGASSRLAVVLVVCTAVGADLLWHARTSAEAPVPMPVGDAAMGQGELRVRT